MAATTKSLVIRIFRWALSAAVLPLIVTFSLYSLDRQGFFNLQEFETVVSSTPQMDPFVRPQLEQLQLRLESFRGESLLRISLGDLKKQILAESWVEQVTLTRSWPHTLRIEITPEKVVALLQHQRTLRPLTREGGVLPPVKVHQAPLVPIAVGENLYKKEELRYKLAHALQEIPEQGRFSQRKISEVYFDDQRGFWMRLLAKDMEVHLGTDRLGLKSARVEQVLEYLDQHQIEARVIDANLSKKVLVRSRKNP